MALTVLLVCLKKGCPRARRLEQSEVGPFVPEGTATIKSFCPWHEPQGAKVVEEEYFDAEGRELLYDG